MFKSRMGLTDPKSISRSASIRFARASGRVTTLTEDARYLRNRRDHPAVLTGLEDNRQCELPVGGSPSSV